MDEYVVLETKDTLERMAGDMEFLRELYTIFLEELPERVAALEAAVSAKDMEQVAKVSHSLKSTAGTIGAIACQKCAEKLEHTARCMEYESVVLLIPHLKTNLYELKSAIDCELQKI